jgi:hypothetical protein
MTQTPQSATEETTMFDLLVDMIGKARSITDEENVARSDDFIARRLLICHESFELLGL